MQFCDPSDDARARGTEADEVLSDAVEPDLVEEDVGGHVVGDGHHRGGEIASAQGDRVAQRGQASRSLRPPGGIDGHRRGQVDLSAIYAAAQRDQDSELVDRCQNDRCVGVVGVADLGRADRRRMKPAGTAGVGEDLGDVAVDPISHVGRQLTRADGHPVALLIFHSAAVATSATSPSADSR